MRFYLVLFACWVSLSFARIVFQSLSETKTHFSNLRSLSVGEHFSFYDSTIQNEEKNVVFVLHYLAEDDMSWYRYIPGTPLKAYPVANISPASYPSFAAGVTTTHLAFLRYLDLHRTPIVDATVTENSFHLLLPLLTGLSTPVSARICPYYVLSSSQLQSPPTNSNCSPEFLYTPTTATCQVAVNGIEQHVAFGDIHSETRRIYGLDCAKRSLFLPYCLFPGDNNSSLLHGGLSEDISPDLLCKDAYLCPHLTEEFPEAPGVTGFNQAIALGHVSISVNKEKVTNSAHDIIRKIRFHVDHPQYDEILVGTLRGTTTMHPDLPYPLLPKFTPVSSEIEFIAQYQPTYGFPINSIAVAIVHDPHNREFVSGSSNIPFIAYGALRCASLPDQSGNIIPRWEGFLKIVTPRASLVDPSLTEFLAPSQNCIVNGPKEAQKYGRRLLPGPDVAPISGPLRSLYPRGIYGIPELAVIRTGVARFTCIDGFVPARDINPLEDTVICQGGNSYDAGQWGQLYRAKFNGHTQFRCVPDVPVCSIFDLKMIDPTISSETLKLIQNIIYYEGDYLRFLLPASEVSTANPYLSPAGPVRLPAFRDEFGRDAPPQCRVDGNNRPYWFWKRDVGSLRDIENFSTILATSTRYPPGCVNAMILLLARSNVDTYEQSLEDYDGKMPIKIAVELPNIQIAKFSCSYTNWGSTGSAVINPHEDSMASSVTAVDSHLLCGELVLPPEIIPRPFDSYAHHLDLKYTLLSSRTFVSSVVMDFSGCSIGYILNPLLFQKPLDDADEFFLRLQCQKNELFWSARMYKGSLDGARPFTSPVQFSPFSTPLCVPTGFGAANESTMELSLLRTNQLSAHETPQPDELRCVHSSTPVQDNLASTALSCATYQGVAQMGFQSSNSVNLSLPSHLSFANEEEVQKDAVVGDSAHYDPFISLTLKRGEFAGVGIQDIWEFFSVPSKHARKIMGIHPRTFQVNYYFMIDGFTKHVNTDQGKPSTFEDSTLSHQFVAGRHAATALNRFREFYFDATTGIFENSYRVQLADLTLRHGTSFCPLESLVSLNIPLSDRLESTDIMYSYEGSVYTSTLPLHGLPRDGLVIMAPKQELNPSHIISHRRTFPAMAYPYAARCRRDGTLGISPTALPLFSPTPTTLNGMARSCNVGFTSKKYQIDTTQKNKLSIELRGYRVDEHHVPNKEETADATIVNTFSALFADISRPTSVFFLGESVAPESLRCVHWGSSVNISTDSSMNIPPSSRLGGRVIPRSPDSAIGGSLYLGAECTAFGWRYLRPDLRRVVLSSLAIRTLVDPAVPLNRALSALKRERNNENNIKTISNRGSSRRQSLITGSSLFEDMFRCLSFAFHATPVGGGLTWAGKRSDSAIWTNLSKDSQIPNFVVSSINYSIHLLKGHQDDFGDIVNVDDANRLTDFEHIISRLDVVCWDSEAECNQSNFGNLAFDPVLGISLLEANQVQLFSTTIFRSLSRNNQKVCGSSSFSERLSIGYPSSSIVGFVPPVRQNLSYRRDTWPYFNSLDCAPHRGFFPESLIQSEPPSYVLYCFEQDQLPSLFVERVHESGGFLFSKLSDNDNICNVSKIQLIIHSASTAFSNRIPRTTQAYVLERRNSALVIPMAPPRTADVAAGRRLSIHMSFPTSTTRSVFGRLIAPLIPATRDVRSSVTVTTSHPATLLQIRLRHVFNSFADMFLPALEFPNTGQIMFFDRLDVPKGVGEYPEVSTTVSLRLDYLRSCTSYLPADFSFSLAEAQASARDRQNLMNAQRDTQCLYCATHVLDPDGGSIVSEISHGQPLAQLFRRKGSRWSSTPGAEGELSPLGDSTFRPSGPIFPCESKMNLEAAFSHATVAGFSLSPSIEYPLGVLCNAEGMSYGNTPETNFKPLSGFEPLATHNVQANGNSKLILEEYFQNAVSVFAPCLPLLKNEANEDETAFSQPCERDMTFSTSNVSFPSKFIMQRYIALGTVEGVIWENTPSTYYIQHLLPGAELSIFRDLAMGPVIPQEGLSSITLRVKTNPTDLSNFIIPEKTPNNYMTGKNTIFPTNANSLFVASELSYAPPFQSVNGVDELFHLWASLRQDKLSELTDAASMPSLRLQLSMGFAIQLLRRKARSLSPAFLPSTHLLAASIPLENSSYFIPEESYRLAVLDNPFWRSPKRRAVTTYDIRDTTFEMSASLSVNDLQPVFTSRLTKWLREPIDFYDLTNNIYTLPLVSTDKLGDDSVFPPSRSLTLPVLFHECKKHPFYSIPNIGKFEIVATLRNGNHVSFVSDFIDDEPEGVFPGSRRHTIHVSLRELHDRLDGSQLATRYAFNSAGFAGISTTDLVIYPSPPIQFFFNSPLGPVVLILSSKPRTSFDVATTPASIYTPYFLSKTVPIQINMDTMDPLVPDTNVFEFHYTFSYYSSPGIPILTPQRRFVWPPLDDPKRIFHWSFHSVCINAAGNPVTLTDSIVVDTRENYSYVAIHSNISAFFGQNPGSKCTITATLDLTREDGLSESTEASVDIFSTPFSLDSPSVSVEKSAKAVVVGETTLSPGFSNTLSLPARGQLTEEGLVVLRDSYVELTNNPSGTGEITLKNALLVIASQLSSFTISVKARVLSTEAYQIGEINYGIRFSTAQKLDGAEAHFAGLYDQSGFITKNITPESTDGSSASGLAGVVEFSITFTARKLPQFIFQNKHRSALLYFHIPFSPKTESGTNLEQVKYLTDAVFITVVAPPRPTILALSSPIPGTIPPQTWDVDDRLYRHIQRGFKVSPGVPNVRDISPDFVDSIEALLPENIPRSSVKVYLDNASSTSLALSTTKKFIKRSVVDREEYILVGVCDKDLRLVVVVNDFLGASSSSLLDFTNDEMSESHPDFPVTCPQLSTSFVLTSFPSPDLLPMFNMANDILRVLRGVLEESTLCFTSETTTATSTLWDAVSLTLSLRSNVDRFIASSWKFSIPPSSQPGSPGYPNGTGLYDHTSQLHISARELISGVNLTLQGFERSKCAMDTIAYQEFFSSWSTDLSPQRQASSFVLSLRGWYLKHAALVDAATRKENVQGLVTSFEVLVDSIGINDEVPASAMQNAISGLDSAMNTLAQMMRSTETKQFAAHEIKRLRQNTTQQSQNVFLLDDADKNDAYTDTDDNNIEDDGDSSLISLIQESRMLLDTSTTLLGFISTIAFLGLDSLPPTAFTPSQAPGMDTTKIDLPQFTQAGDNMQVSLTYLPKDLQYDHQITFSDENPGSDGSGSPLTIQVPPFALHTATQSTSAVSSLFSITNEDFIQAILDREDNAASASLGIVSLSLLDSKGIPIDVSSSTHRLSLSSGFNESGQDWFFIEIPFSSGSVSSSIVNPASRCIYTENMKDLANDSSKTWDSDDSCRLHEITPTSIICRCTHLTFFSVRLSTQALIPRFQEITLDHIRLVNWENFSRNLVPFIILVAWPVMTLLVMVLTYYLDARYYRQGIEKLLLDWDISKQSVVTKMSVYKVTNNDSIFYILWRRYWYAIRDTNIWFSVFFRQTTHNYSSQSRALTGMILLLSSFTLSGIFSGYTDQGFITVVIMTSICLFIISEILRFIFDRSEKDKIKRFVYYYAESLAYFYFTGKSLFFPVSEHQELMKNRPASLVESGGAELSALVLSLGWEGVPMGAVHAHPNPEVPSQEKKTLFDKSIVRQYAFGDVDTFYYRTRNHEYRLSAQEAAKVHMVIRQQLPRSVLNADDISVKFRNRDFVDYLPSFVRLVGLVLLLVWVAACYFLVIVTSAVLASNSNSTVTASPITDWVTSAGISVLLELFVTSFVLGLVKSTGLYFFSYFMKTKCCCCTRQPSSSDLPPKIEAMPEIKTFRRLSYFEPVADIEMAEINCKDIVEHSEPVIAPTKLWQLADKPEMEDVDDFGDDMEIQFTANLNRVGPSLK